MWWSGCITHALTSILDGHEWSASTFRKFILLKEAPNTLWKRGCVGPWTLWRREKFLSLLGIEFRFSGFVYHA